MKVFSPMPLGSGAIVVHRMLAKYLSDYEVHGYNPYLTLFPPLLRWIVPPPDADLIHTTPDHAVFFRKPGRHLVTTFHNLVIDGFMRQYCSSLQWFHYQTDLRWFLQRALKVSTLITAVSRFTADIVVRELGSAAKIEVIPNGIDTERFRPVSQPKKRSGLRILFAGNPSYRKGVQWLPAIADRLNRDDRIVCATGLRDRWQSLRNHQRIDILGGVSFEEMPLLYQSVDALLMPTVREGDSLVVLEAMSCGLPVVATDCSSLSERIQHGKGGFLCDIGDVNQFVSSIDALRDAGMREEMGKFNRDRALREFSVELMAMRYAELFASVCT